MNGIIRTYIQEVPRDVCGNVRGLTNTHWRRIDMSILTHKQCKVCGEVKPVSEFYKYRRMKDGYCNDCKSCRNESSRQSYLKNKDKVNERATKWRLSNVEKARAAVSKYLKSAKGKAMRITNYFKDDSKKEYARKWGMNNRGKTVSWAKRWRQENPEKYSIGKKNRYSRQKGAEGSYSLEQWSLIVNYYCPDGNCLACGKQARLTVDHVVSIVKGGSNYPGNLQPLCTNCNASKREKIIDYRPDCGAYARSLQDG